MNDVSYYVPTYIGTTQKTSTNYTFNSFFLIIHLLSPDIALMNKSLLFDVIE